MNNYIKIGIGKTTTARLIAKELGYDVIEKNASDVRNKSSNEQLLNHLIDNQLVSFKKEIGVRNVNLENNFLLFEFLLLEISHYNGRSRWHVWRRYIIF